MKKVTYESWVSSFVERLSGYFNFAGWDVSVEFSDEQPAATDDGIEYAHVHVNSTYQQAILVISPQGKEDFENKEMDRLIKSLVHELVHVFLDPFQEQMHPHLSITTSPMFLRVIEQQTQKLTMVFLKTLPKELIPPIG